MAAPKVTETYHKVSDKVLIFFDKPLDDTVQFPATCFSLNYGKVPITGASYYGTAGLILTLGREMTYRDKLELNYQPPEDVTLALRAPVGDGSSTLVMKRNAVRAFYKVPVKNMMAPDENAWMANSNLGGGKQFVPDPNNPDFDGSIPGFDICGDGSIIVGNPNNIINNGDGETDVPNGAITSMGQLTGGAGYTDGEYADTALVGGSGTGAVATLTVAQGAVTTVVLTANGQDYAVSDILTAPLTGFTTPFSIEVDGVHVSTGEVDTFSETTTQGAAGSGGSLNAVSYPVFDRPRPRSATPDDFVLAYGLKEAIQISNLDDADATQPNNEKIWMAIEDAAALVDNYISQAQRAGKLLISSNRRRTTLIIARYYLDTVRRREDIKADYELCITELDKARDLRDMQRPDLPWWADPCNPNRAGGIRSHRIPQYYNGVSGKGLDGYWVDSGAEEQDDFRVDGDNSQNNNDRPNYSTKRSGTAPREPEQPTDDGGSEPGGGSF